MKPDLHTLTDADLEALPGPIAIPAARYAGETDPRIKLLLMIDTVETIFKYGSAIVVQTMRKKPYWDDFKASTRPKPLLELLERPQLGEHIGIIQSVFYFFRNRPSTKPKILNWVTPLSEPVLCTSLNTLRNRRKGHGAWPTESVALGFLTDFRESFLKIIALAKSLHREYPLYLDPHGVRFSGPRPPAGGSMDSERLVLRNAEGRTLSLYPFFLVAGSGSVLFNGVADRHMETAGAVTFLDYGTGADDDHQSGDTVDEDFKASFLLEDWLRADSDIPATLQHFTGRDDDRNRLDAFAGQRTVSLLLVHGERGVGKTTLLDKWWQTLEASDAPPSDLVLRIRHIITEGSTRAEPREIAKSLLYQLDRDANPEFDWKPDRFRREILHGLQSLSGPSLILIDGLDESATTLTGADDSLFDWIPSPSETGGHILWILGFRSLYLGNPGLKSLMENMRHEIHQVPRFTLTETKEYLRKSLDRRTVDQQPEVLPLVMDLTGGLPLDLFLLKSSIQAGEVKYNEVSLRAFDIHPSGLLRHAIAQALEKAGRLEEHLCRDDFAREERLLEARLKQGRLSATEYQDECLGRKAGYRQAGETRFAHLMAFFALTKEALTADVIASVLDVGPASVPRYLVCASRFLREDQDGYSFSHLAFREHLASEKPEWLQTFRPILQNWCTDPANRCHGYVIRHGAAHLLETLEKQDTPDTREKLAELLSDLDYITIKIRAGLVPELLQDYEQALTCLTGSPSSMFHDLEPDDTDWSWIEANRTARLTGQPLPFPDKGGDYIIRKIRERREEEERQRQERDRIRKAENLAAGRTEDYYPSWDFDDEIAGDDQIEEALTPATEKPAYGTTLVDEPTVERDYRAEHIRESELEEVRRFGIASGIFVGSCATARGVAKIRRTEGNSKSPLVSRIEEFAGFVEESWSLLADEAYLPSAIGHNYRHDGSIHETGKALISGKTSWIELGNRPYNDVRKLKLDFKSTGPDDDASEIRFFMNFTRCLRVTIVDFVLKGSSEYAFELLDVKSNRILTTTKIRHEFGSNHREMDFRITEDGTFGRYRSTFFALNPETCIIRLLDGPESIPSTILAQIDGFDPEKKEEHGKTVSFLPNADRTLRLRSDFDHSLRLEFNDGSEEIETFPYLGHLSVLCFHFAATGRVVIIKESSRIYVIDLCSATILLKVNVRNYSWSIAFTEDARLIAVDDGGEITVWDVLSGNALRRFTLGGLLSGMQFSASGELLHARGFVCDLRTGSCPPSLKDFDWAGSQFDLSNRRYSVIEDHILDTETGLQYHLNDGLSAPKLDEEDLGMVLTDQCLIRVLDTSFAFMSAEHPDLWTQVTEVDYTYSRLITEENWKSPDDEMRGFIAPSACRESGMILLPCRNGILYLMNPMDGRVCLITDPEYLRAMDLTVGQAMLEQYLQSRWEKEPRENMVKTMGSLGLDAEPAAGPVKKRPQFYINAAVISDDGQWILTATDWDAVRVWEVASGHCVRNFPLPAASDFFAGHVQALSLTPDGKGCYLCLEDGSSHLLESWKEADLTWSPVLKLSGTCEVYCRALVNRRYAYRHAFTTKSHQIHDLVERRVIDLTPLNPQFPNWCYSFLEVTITPDNRHLVVANDRTLFVFALNTMKEATRFPLPGKFKSMSNLTSDGWLVVMTEAGDLLRLKLHLAALTSPPN